MILPNGHVIYMSGESYEDAVPFGFRKGHPLHVVVVRGDVELLSLLSHAKRPFSHARLYGIDVLEPHPYAYVAIGSARNQFPNKQVVG